MGAGIAARDCQVVPYVMITFSQDAREAEALDAGDKRCVARVGGEDYQAHARSPSRSRRRFEPQARWERQERGVHR